MHSAAEAGSATHGQGPSQACMQAGRQAGERAQILLSRAHAGAHMARQADLLVGSRHQGWPQHHPCHRPPNRCQRCQQAGIPVHRGWRRCGQRGPGQRRAQPGHSCWRPSRRSGWCQQDGANLGSVSRDLGSVVLPSRGCGPNLSAEGRKRRAVQSQRRSVHAPKARRRCSHSVAAVSLRQSCALVPLAMEPWPCEQMEASLRSCSGGGQDRT